jgi:hypothetical protein
VTRPALTGALAFLLGGCAAKDGDTGTGPTFEYPLDDTLTFADLWSVGTHNSYHLRTDGVDRPEWDYEHRPLDEQLGVVGVRQFELDIWYVDGAFQVYHVPVLDQASSCPLLVECLDDMKRWSDRNPGHQPLLTLLEVKDPLDDDGPGDYFDVLEAELLSVWPRERLVTPDDVTGGQGELRDVLAADGWPTLGTMRGKALFVLHDGGDWRDAYTDGLTTSAGRLLFPDAQGDPTLPVAAVHTMNDPADPRIAEVVALGHLVRTRADSDGNQARDGDTSSREAALASGAHFVSTDFPEPAPETGYLVTIPGGTPSACNPVHAPEACGPEDIEDPAFIVP